MRRRIFSGFLLLYLGILAIPVEAAGWAGDWVGSATVDGRTIWLKLFLSDHDRKRAVLEAPFEDVTNCQADLLRKSGKRLSVWFRYENHKIYFSGDINGDEFLGNVEWQGVKGLFTLRRRYKIEPWTYLDYEGNYRWTGGDDVLFFRMDNDLFLMRGDTLCPLYCISADTFITEKLEKVRFVRDPEDSVVTHALWDSGEGSRLKIERVHLYDEEDIVFQNGKVRLSGTLYRPSSTGPHPGVILVHGSGPEDRGPYRMFADYFTRRGFAAFIYDKRGVGASSGNRRTSSLHELADDACAAYRALKNHPAVDAQRIGYWGISQGGLVVTLAAGKSPEAAFAILVSTSGVNPAEQHLYLFENDLTTLGYPEETIHRVLSLWRTFFRYQSAGSPWDELTSEITSLRKIEGLRSRLPLLPEEVRLQEWYFRFDVYHDPLLPLQLVRCPLLFIYGAKDRVVPPRTSERLYGQILDRTGVVPFHIQVFPDGNHNLQMAENGGRQEWNKLRDFVPGYMDLMVQWMARYCSPQTIQTDVSPVNELRK